MISKKFKITTPAGIQAGSAAIVVQTASQYQSEILIQKDDKKVNLKSIMGVMSLAIYNGATITISADGHDEESALKDLEEVLKSNNLAE